MDLPSSANASYKILSVGGSIVILQTGFDIEFLKKFHSLIMREVKAGGKFILVIGGGATARQYQAATRNSKSTGPKARSG
jgi:uridylate kinase